MITFLLFASFAAPGSDELFDAARKGDAAGVKAALDSGVPVDATWRYNQTALFIAAGRGHTAIVKMLLDRGAKADVRDSFYGMTAVMAAADKEKPELVTMLLDKGAQGADSLLMMAAAKGNTPMVRALASRAGLDPKLLTQALSSAEAGKHTDAAAVLREAGAKPAPPFDPATLERFRGKYATLPMGREVLSVEPRGALLTVIGSSMQMDFRPLDELTFEPVQYPGMERLVFIVDGGKVTGAESIQAQRTIRYKRLEEKQK